MHLLKSFFTLLQHPVHIKPAMSLSRPKAQVSYDRFHIAALANAAMDEIRRDEMRRGRCGKQEDAAPAAVRNAKEPDAMAPGAVRRDELAAARGPQECAGIADEAEPAAPLPRDGGEQLRRGRARRFDEVDQLSPRLSPVAHPSLGTHRLDDPQIVARSVLLTFEGDSSPCWNWEAWLEAQGWSGLKPKGIIRFNLFDQMIHATIAGQGIALGRRQFIRPMLDDGRLIALPTPCPGPRSNKVF